MKFFWQLTYNILFLPLLFILVMIGYMFNEKIREGIKGRWKTYSTLKDYINNIGKNKLIYWFHSASHGEYEQIQLVLKGLKEVEPSCISIVTFFSPSGFNHISDPNIDCKVYLPIDFIWTCCRLLKLVRPHKLIFAEYDVWPNYIWCAKRYRIKTSLFSARLHKKSTKLYPILRSLYKHVYKCIDSIYTISENDYINVRRLIGKRNRAIVRVLGNPRYDRVKEIADEPDPERTYEILDRDNRLIVGSTHLEDENIILPTVLELLNQNSEISIYWTPHETSKKNITRNMNSFKNANISFTLLSRCHWNHLRHNRVVIVDKVGFLSRLYWHGRYAYIGGGFSSGIHNVMEPAIARLPVIFGPKYHNSGAAEELLKYGGGFCISSGDEFLSALSEMMNVKENLIKASQAATKVIYTNLGSSTRVVRGILRD